MWCKLAFPSLDKSTDLQHRSGFTPQIGLFPSFIHYFISSIWTELLRKWVSKELPERTSTQKWQTWYNKHHCGLHLEHGSRQAMTLHHRWLCLRRQHLWNTRMQKWRALTDHFGHASIFYEHIRQVHCQLAELCMPRSGCVPTVLVHVTGTVSPTADEHTGTDAWPRGAIRGSVFWVTHT